MELAQTLVILNRLRNELYDIAGRVGSLTDPQVVEASWKLDQAIYHYLLQDSDAVAWPTVATYTP